MENSQEAWLDWVSEETTIPETRPAARPPRGRAASTSKARASKDLTEAARAAKSARARAEAEAREEARLAQEEIRRAAEAREAEEAAARAEEEARKARAEEEAAKAEAARAEEERVAAATARAEADAQRARAEEERVAAETKRAEEEAAKAEAARAEEERVAAETARAEEAAKAEAARAEEERVVAETARAEADARKARAEEELVAAETKRAEEEAAKAKAARAEEERVAAETARAEEAAKAEAARAEEERVVAETARAEEQAAKAEAARAEEQAAKAEAARAEAEAARAEEETPKARAEKEAVAAEAARADEEAQKGSRAAAREAEADERPRTPPELVASNVTASGAPTVPVGAPDHLLVLLRELERKLAQGEPRRGWAATRDALGLLTRYYAGILPAAWRNLAAPPPEMVALWREGRSTTERVELIRASLQALGELTEDPLARVLVEVFYDRDKPRTFTRLLGVGEPPEGMQILPEWFAANPEPPDEAEAGKQLQAYLPVLQEWVDACRRFFQDCDHRFETGNKFGQMELVVRWRDKLLRTGFTLRLREGRKSGKFSAVQIPTAPGPAPASPQQPVPSTAPPTPQEAEELTRLIVSMLQKEHTGPVKPRPKKKEEVPEEKPPEPPPAPRMHHQVTYIGPDRSEAGRYSYRGRIEVILPDDSPVKGHVRSSHPKVTVKPTQFEGSYAKLDYWIDPSAVNEEQAEYLIIQTQDEVRKLPLTMLLPSSKIPNLTPLKAILMLLLPGLVGTGYVLFRFYYSLAKVKQLLLSYTTPAFQETYLGRQPVPLQGTGISTLEVDVLPMVETTALFFLMLAVLAPLITTKLYQRLPTRQQGELGMVYLLGMTLPLIIFSIILTGPALSSRLFIHPELRVMSFGHQFVWFATYNLSASIYLFLSVTGILDNWIKSGYVRLLLPIVLFGLFIASSLYLVYG